MVPPRIVADRADEAASRRAGADIAGCTPSRAEPQVGRLWHGQHRSRPELPIGVVPCLAFAPRPGQSERLMVSSQISSRDCVDTRVVSIGTQVRLWLPTLAITMAILVGGSVALLLRASQRDRLSATAVILVVLLPTLFVLLLSGARRRMGAEQTIAAFKLNESSRRRLGLAAAEGKVARRNIGSFKLACREGRATLMHGLTIHDLADLGIEATVLLRGGGSVVGVELRRGGEVVRANAFGTRS